MAPTPAEAASTAARAAASTRGIPDSPSLELQALSGVFRVFLHCVFKTR